MVTTRNWKEDISVTRFREIKWKFGSHSRQLVLWCCKEADEAAYEKIIFEKKFVGNHFG